MNQYLIIRHMGAAFECWGNAALEVLSAAGAYDPRTDTLMESMLSIETIGHYRECLLIAPPAGRSFVIWSNQVRRCGERLNFKVEAITGERLQWEKTIYAEIPPAIKGKQIKVIA
jgi:hypothetical protein